MALVEYYGTGRRKTSTARVHIRPGSGAITARIANRDILTPYYAGPAPSISGVQQVNIVIPADLPAGAAQVDVCAIGSDPNQRICSMPASVVVK